MGHNLHEKPNLYENFLRLAPLANQKIFQMDMLCVLR